MRYKVHGAWSIDASTTYPDRVITIQRADCIDTRNGTIYRDGAYRVLVDGKAIKGKGGTTPYWGEMAWNDAERKADDLYWAVRNG